MALLLLLEQSMHKFTIRKCRHQHHRNRNLTNKFYITTLQLSLAVKKNNPLLLSLQLSSKNGTRRWYINNDNVKCIQRRHGVREIDVTPLANAMRRSVQEYTATHNINNNGHQRICMVGILIDVVETNSDHDINLDGNNKQNNNHTTSTCTRKTDAETYSEMIRTRFEQDGIRYIEHRHCVTVSPSSSSSSSDSSNNKNRNVNDAVKEIQSIIQHYNDKRPDIHGILIFYPIFPRNRNNTDRIHKNYSSIYYYINPSTGVRYSSIDDYIRDCVIPIKDVEGVGYPSISEYDVTTTPTSTTTPTANGSGINKNEYGTNGDYQNLKEQKQIVGSSSSSLSMFAAAVSKAFRARSSPTPYNFQRLPQQDVFIPCTVTAILKILDYYHPMSTTRSINAIESNKNNVGNKSMNNATDIDTIPINFTTPVMQYYHTNQRYKDCVITIVNRSTILGRPLAALLALQGGLVYSIDETSILRFYYNGTKTIVQRCDTIRTTKTNISTTTSTTQEKYGQKQQRQRTLNDCLNESSIIITAVPDVHFQLAASAIQDNTTIINVSEYNNIHEIVEQLSSDKYDDDDKSCRRNIRYVSSIGKVTVAALEHNLIRLYERNANKDDKQK